STRDLYRRAIEDLARGSNTSEIDVAKRAIAAAKRPIPNASELSASDAGAIPRREHDPGYYLIARGRRGFEVELGYRPPLGKWPYRLSAMMGVSGYLGAIAIIAAAILVLSIYATGMSGSGQILFWLVLLGALPASDIAVSLVNRLVTKRFGPAL